MSNHRRHLNEDFFLRPAIGQAARCTTYSKCLFKSFAHRGISKTSLDTMKVSERDLPEDSYTGPIPGIHPELQRHYTPIRRMVCASGVAYRNRPLGTIICEWCYPLLHHWERELHEPVPNHVLVHRDYRCTPVCIRCRRDPYRLDYARNCTGCKKAFKEFRPMLMDGQTIHLE